MAKTCLAYSEAQLTAVRRAAIGFVFQSFNLIDDLTVEENVEVALLYRSVPAKERRARVAEALERVGIAHRARHLPQQLSGGQQQRVAVARALVSAPKVILADEPTGNLDTANGNAVMELLINVAKAGTTVVMVTHSLTYAALAAAHHQAARRPRRQRNLVSRLKRRKPPMFRNYLAAALRNLMRNKLVSVINIAGLAIGIRRGPAHRTLPALRAVLR